MRKPRRFRVKLGPCLELAVNVPDRRRCKCQSLHARWRGALWANCSDLTGISAYVILPSFKFAIILQRMRGLSVRRGRGERDI